MDDPKSDIADFANIIQVDPGLSAKVLKIVNSAYFGFPGKIENLTQAINMIGISQLHNMVLGVSAISALDFPNDIVPLRELWRSSLYSGVLARLFGNELKVRQSDRLYIIGLLHEIGHLLLYAKFPDQARDAIQVSRQNGIGIHQAEHQVLGCHYGEVGARLMDNWQLSPFFQQLTQFQPTPLISTENQLEISILHLAHAYADKKFFNPDVETENLIDESIWPLVDLTQEQLTTCLESADVISSDMEKVILK